MPWCEECAKYFAPSSMTDDGRCPKCGKVADLPDAHGRITAKNLDLKALAKGDDEAGDQKAPWHFKLLMAALVLYLSWRVVDLFR
jgi:hypothetical protein